MNFSKAICNNCGKEYNTDFEYFRDIREFRDLHNKIIKKHCKDCIENEMIKQQELAFVEEYNGCKIYKNELGGYHPYWGSHYYFKELQDCRDRIDNRTVSIPPIY